MEAISPLQTLSEAKRTLACKRILDALAQGASRGVAAAGAGIARQTFYNWLHEDPAFRTAVEQTEAEVFRAVEAVAFQCALKAAEDPRYQSSLRFFLTHRARWTTEPEAVEQERYEPVKRTEFLAWIDRVLAENRDEEEADGTSGDEGEPEDGADEPDDTDESDDPINRDDGASEPASFVEPAGSRVPAGQPVAPDAAQDATPRRAASRGFARHTGPPDDGVSGCVF